MTATSLPAPATSRTRSGRSWSAPRHIPVLGTVWHFALAHPAITVFFIALVARFATAAVLDVVLERSIILDDAGYSALAVERANGEDAQWDDGRRGYFDRNAAFVWPLSLLYSVVGPVQLAGQWFVALIAALAAALTVRIALEAVEPPWALMSGLVVALLPSQVFFSSLTLKDAMVWAATAGVALAAAVCPRLPSRWRALGLLAAVALVFLSLTRLRPHIVIIGLCALFLSALVPAERRRFRAVGAALLLLAVPWIGGLGPAGLSYVTGISSIGGYRVAQAIGNTALIAPPLGFDKVGTEDAPAAHGTDTSSPSAVPSAPATAQEVRPELEPELGLGADVRHLPRGLSATLLEPYPWQRSHNVQLDLAKAEMAIWYPLVLLAAVGAYSVLGAGWAGMRILGFPVLYGAAAVGVGALAEGNFGTAFRHRGQIVWVVALLASFGARHLWLTRQGRTAPPGLTNVV